MTRYMLDTNAVSHLLRQHPALSIRVMATPMASLCISAITAGELLFGLAKRPEAVRLKRAVLELLRRVDALPWDNDVAEHYGTLRAATERSGTTLGSLDLLIASHAQAVGAVLVTNDGAFRRVTGLTVEDWTV
jgi:tRNA(fMet)-specific endonuclease VapC